MKKTIPVPTHYAGDIEPKDYISSHNLNFNRGCAVKYLTRAGRKAHNGLSAEQVGIDDLYKAIDYIQFEIEALNKELDD